MHALNPLACVLTVVALGGGSDDAPRSDHDVVAPEGSTGVVLAQRTPNTRQRRRRPVEKRRDEEKSALLDTLWSIFAPPGDYTLAVGAGVGTTFTETAFGTPNPNLTGRLQVTYRPLADTLPVSVYGSFDYLNYEQTAGPLRYQSQFYTLGAGGGLQYWFGGTRLDLLGELDALVRVSTQTDGQIEPITSVNVSPGATLLAGGALSLFGWATLTMHAGARLHGLRSFDVINDSRVDGLFLVGLEFITDARPFDPY